MKLKTCNSQLSCCLFIPFVLEQWWSYFYSVIHSCFCCQLFYVAKEVPVTVVTYHQLWTSMKCTHSFTTTTTRRGWVPTFIVQCTVYKKLGPCLYRVHTNVSWCISRRRLRSSLFVAVSLINAYCQPQTKNRILVKNPRWWPGSGAATYFGDNIFGNYRTVVNRTHHWKTIPIKQ